MNSWKVTWSKLGNNTYLFIYLSICFDQQNYNIMLFFLTLIIKVLDQQSYLNLFKMVF